MKYLLIDCDSNLEHLENSDLTQEGISDERFEEIAREEENGLVIENTYDFVSRFNSEHINTSTHQLRIVKES